MTKKFFLTDNHYINISGPVRRECYSCNVLGENFHHNLYSSEEVPMSDEEGMMAIRVETRFLQGSLTFPIFLSVLVTSSVKMPA